ncbi:hypothetical protein SO802_019106 [Lithocarpus litseifolius]|uniref:Zinc knuckle CX2CX4HX4C domain-containing protein n=1 Tax=Lithocarpus litseifolius TaxID=425828 RepID=A0AAW2CN82_9ROSI
MSDTLAPTRGRRTILDIDSNDEVQELCEGLAAVKLSKDVKHHIRALNELPIEYYDVEVLKQLGNSIGKVLRIDAHTTAETRGRFARLCVQVDIDKPLITTILVGGLRQPVIYEGTHRLCFMYGRIGHRKEACPYAIREPASPERPGDASKDYASKHPHDLCDQVDPMLGGEHTPQEQEDTYRPWLVVARKRQHQRMRGGTEGGTVGNPRARNGMARPQVGHIESSPAGHPQFIGASKSPNVGPLFVRRAELACLKLKSQMWEYLIEGLPHLQALAHLLGAKKVLPELTVNPLTHLSSSTSPKTSDHGKSNCDEFEVGFTFSGNAMMQHDGRHNHGEPSTSKACHGLAQQDQGSLNVHVHAHEE